jgi:hypothetical protein
MASRIAGTVHSALSEGNTKRPVAEIRRSPSRLFSSQTSVKAITDTQSSMRDNGDGLSTGARYGQANPRLGCWS